MVQEIINDPGLFITVVGAVIWGLAAHAAESPKYWKLWKYTTPTMLVGVVVAVIGCILAINGR